MGKNNHRQMGTRIDKSRLQTRICKKTSVFGNKTHTSFRKKSKYHSKGNKQSFRKKGYRKSKFKRNTFRFLQHIIFSTQKEWGDETRHKPETPQPVSPEATFQDGHAIKSFRSGRERRLGYVNRFERCLFSHQSVQETQAVSSVSISGHSISVSRPLFWSDKRPTSFHESDFSGSSAFKEKEYSAVQLSGRLVCAKPSKNDAVGKSSNNTQSPLQPGLYCKQDKVSTCPIAAIDLSRKSFQSGRRSSVSKQRKNNKSERSSYEYSERSKHCETFSCSAGYDSFLPRIDSECQIVHEANTDSFATELEPVQNEIICTGSSYSRSDFKSEMVVTGSKHCKGQILRERVLSSNPDHRCEWQGLGRSHEQSDMSRPVEQNAKITSHKLPGDDGCYTELTPLSFPSEGSESSCQVRQHDSLPVYKPSGRNQISPTLQSDKRIVGLGPAEQDHVKSSSHLGSEESFGRCSEPGEGSTDRMVSERVSCTEDIQSVGPANSRFVCNIPKQKDNSVLFMDASCTSICSGCPINCMAEHVCVCFSTISTSAQSLESSAKLSLHNDTDSPTVATSALLQSDAKTVDSIPTETSVQSEVVDSVQGKGCSPPAGTSSSDCMVVIDRHLSTKGFSSETRELLAKSWRKGTQKDYKSKFRKFSCWCHERDINPYLASLANCADFLTGLFDKGLQYRTINGYRSMLSSVLAPVENIPLGQHPFIIRLLKGVFNERPPMKRLVPEWDLFLVLGCLKAAPFEPMKESSLKFVTWKTCFLLAITTFRRCSDLQSLCLGEGFVNVQKQGMTFIRTGLSKQDRPGHVSRTIFVPALPQNKLLDPKRALTYYLRKTEGLRKSKSGQDITKLFLSVIKPNLPVSAQTISRWLVEAIKFCYKKAGKSVGKIKGHSTRSIGPSWALFKGASLQQIMEAAIDLGRPLLPDII